MARDAIQVRVQRVRPGGVRATAGEHAWASHGRERAQPDTVAAIAFDAEPPAGHGERWERAQELWRQATFFLFDGDSWRR